MLKKDNKKILLLSMLLATFVVVLYGQFLWSPTFFDDGSFFTLDDAGRPHVLQFAVSFSPLVLRSLPYATLAWTAQIFGYDLIGFRIGNLLFHAATVVALFFFLLQLFEAVLPKDTVRPDGLKLRWFAFFAALLFALHPVAVFAVGYLVQRTIVMATLFSLLAMYSYVRGSVRQNQGWLWASVFFYYWAVYSKEHVVMLPVIMMTLGVLLHENWCARIKRQWPIFAAYMVIALLVILAKKGVLGGVYEVNAPEMLQAVNHADAYPFSVLTQSWLFFKYGALWLFPNPEWMSIDMREPFAKSYFSLYALAFAAFVVYGIAAVRLLLMRGMLGLLGFALLFPWLMFMTELSTVRIQESFVLYRSYVWAVGGAALLPFIFWRVTARGAVLMLSIFVAFVFMVAMERLSTFSHPVLVWDDAEKLVKGRSDLPGIFRIYSNRGVRYLAINEFDKAISDLKHSVELYPQQPYAFNYIGVAYAKKGELDEAVRYFTIAIQLSESSNDPATPRYYDARAATYEEQKNWAAASADYKVTCKLVKKRCDKTNLPQPESSPKSQ